jgi:aminoglycoside 3-N-acetyltransferase
VAGEFEMTKPYSWVDRVREGRRRHGLLGFVRREARRILDRRVRPIRGADIRRTLIDVGIEPGDTVCVHSALSRVGYVEGGADAVIDELQARLGPTGTLLMPSFPTSGSMLDYLDAGEPFDVRHSPSRVGLITEVFRRRPDVHRSLHPTSAVCAWGAGAERYLDRHEHSPTPFGDATPYGRLANDPRAKILMIETHVHSFLHHLQERVDFPNLFLPGVRPARYVDHDGVERTTMTRVMRPRIPYFVALSDRGAGPDDWAILHDFCLLYPPRRVRACAARGYRFTACPSIPARHARLTEAGVLAQGRLGRGRVGCLRVSGYLDRIEPELRDLLTRFRAMYDPEALEARMLPYV